MFYELYPCLFSVLCFFVFIPFCYMFVSLLCSRFSTYLCVVLLLCFMMVGLFIKWWKLKKRQLSGPDRLVGFDKSPSVGTFQIKLSMTGNLK